MLDTIIEREAPVTGNERVTGVETAAYANSRPWGDLGTSVHNDLTPEQMLQKAGLDWEVKLFSTFCRVGKQHVPVPRKKALVRTSDNRILTEVGPGWKPVQNAEAFGFFHEFVMNGDMEMDTAGSLHRGRIVWALAKIKNGTFSVGQDDPVESYLLFYNPHDYGKRLGIMFTNIRVWCDNTLTLALSSSKNSVFFNHRRAFDPEYAKEVLGLADFRKQEIKETAEFLASKRTTEETLDQYFGHLFGRKKNGEPKKMENIVRDHYETQPGVERGEGTWWQAVNSITYALDHEIGRSIDSRLDSGWFGKNASLKRRAVTEAVEMAKAA